MCGINGIILFDQCKPSSELAHIVELMNEKIIHRGPDEEGCFVNNSLGLGIRRLSIIDLKTGSQPIFNEDHTLVMVCNGEIYNFKTLRQILIKKGHLFSTRTDSEVIIHAYEEYGNDFLDKLEGMFAFALYDIKQKKVILARDRLGEKPCYFYKDQHRLIFASELQSLLSTGYIKKTINKHALAQYLQLTYIPSPLTIYEGVYKLKPAHYLEINLNGDIKENCYWHLSYKKTLMGYDDACQTLRKKILESVKNCMISDVPVGAFLSGGIDSASIVSSMAQLSDKPVETFTIGFANKKFDERDKARLVANLYKTNHHEFVLNFNQAITMIDRLIETMAEPFADISTLPTYFISQFASEQVKVVLTGDAGDEIFGGYNKYLINYFSKIYCKIPRFLRKGFIEPIVFKIRDRNFLSRKIKKVISASEKSYLEQSIDLMTLGFKRNELELLLNPQHYQSDSLKFIKEIYKEAPANDSLNKTLYTDLKVVLEGDIFNKVDKMSMLNSLETRVPFAARSIVEFAATLPIAYKIKNKNLKIILKDSMRNALPPQILNAPKSGFEIPLGHWFRNELKPELLAVLNKKNIEKQGFFNYSYINRIIQEHLSCKVNRRYELWVLYVFTKWYSKQQ
ncbi:MAG: asparagine synthase (glutamine-hydrolyzing) [Candidatus Rifleibacteriota bacterium]